jgi:hypothetical protein
LGAPLLEQRRGLPDQGQLGLQLLDPRLAAASSPRSLVEVPGLIPRSMRSWAFTGTRSPQPAPARRRPPVPAARPAPVPPLAGGTPDRRFVARVLLGVGTRQSHMTRSSNGGQIPTSSKGGPDPVDHRPGPIIRTPPDAHTHCQGLTHLTVGALAVASPCDGANRDQDAFLVHKSESIQQAHHAPDNTRSYGDGSRRLDSSHGFG